MSRPRRAAVPEPQPTLAYGLVFPGREDALQQLAAPPRGTLTLRREAATTLVVGDNLDVLKHLARSHAGAVDAIYIDPPYNRGGDFVYRDRVAAPPWSESALRAALPAAARRAEARRSAPWLAMMLPRLALARTLLRDEGVLFVSIDDAEVHHLRLLLDELFGRERFVAQIVVVSNRGGRDYLPIAITHEYVLCYAKGDAPRLAELPRAVTLPHDDARGAYELRELRNRNPRFTPANRPNLSYPVWIDPSRSDAAACHPVSLTRQPGAIELWPRNREGAPSVWRWGQPKLAAALVAGDPTRSEVVAKRRRDGGYNLYEKHRKTTTKARALWDDPLLRSEQGSIELRAELGAALFDHPKPIELVRRCLELGCGKDGLVLDFFAGSGTTALAVAALNAADGGRRRCLLVQQPEPTPPRSAAAQAGLTDIAAIAAHRLRHALGRRAVAVVRCDAPTLTPAPARARRSTPSPRR
ncbi:MAG: site-specific DNA-methyltransferase [Nannocystaceae bacterium]|nr:site-specific DNA-methyltransferase [Nannocystaceae bacterium]